MAVNPNIKKKADDIRNKIYGKEVRESLASGLEEMSSDVVENEGRQSVVEGRQDSVESQWQAVSDEMTDKDVISAPEIIAARNGEANLKTRIDKDHQEVTAQLAQYGWSVKDFGAKGDGMTDDTVSFQKTIDHAKNSKIKKVIVPSGNYRISNLDLFGKEYSGITLEGLSNPIIEQILTTKKIIPDYGTPTYARSNRADGIIVIDANVINPTASFEHYAVSDIVIKGITFKNSVENELEFDELSHQIVASGVDNLTIQNCSFIGFLSDGVCVLDGRGHGFSSQLENRNVKVWDSFFDGVNKGNRNAISIYHCDGFDVGRNFIINTTRPDMPGAIDVEPTYTSLQTRSGYIHDNYIKNCGGNVGAIAIVLYNREERVNTQRRFTISRNTIIDSFCGPVIYSHGEHDKKDFKNVVIEENYVLNGFGFRIVRSNHVTLRDNTFENVGFQSFSISNCNEILLENNVFDGITNNDGLLISENSSNISIEKNTFTNIAKHAITSNGNGIQLLRDNKFTRGLNPGSVALVSPYHTAETIAGLFYENNFTDSTVDDYNIDLVKNINRRAPISFATPPSKFMFGTSTVRVVDTIFGNGFLITLKVGNFVTQEFRNIDPTKEIYYRSEGSDDTWTQWRKVERVVVD